MSHDAIREKLKTAFPHYDHYLSEWWPAGLNAIRIRLTTGDEFIFTVGSMLTLESTDDYISRIKNKEMKQ